MTLRRFDALAPSQDPGQVVAGLRTQLDEQNAYRDFEWLPGWLGTSLWLLDRPAAALRGAYLEPTYEGGNPLTGFVRGLSGRDSYNFDTYWGSGIGSFTAQVLADPLFLTGGAGVTKKGAQLGLKAGAKAFTREAAEQVGKQIATGQRAGLPFVGRLFVNPFRPNTSGISTSHLVDRALQVTGFNGLARFGEIEARLMQTAGSLRTAAFFRTGFGEKAAILKGAFESFRAHAGDVASAGTVASAKSFLRDFDEVVRNSAQGFITRLERQAAQPLFAAADRDAYHAAVLSKEVFDKVLRVGDPILPRGGLKGENLTRQGLEDFLARTIEEWPRMPAPQREAIMAANSPLSNLVQAMVATHRHELVSSQALGITLKELGNKPALAQRLERAEELLKGFRGLRQTFTALRAAGGEVTDKELQKILKAEGQFLSSRQRAQYRDWFRRKARTLRDIDEFFSRKISKAHSAIRMRQTALEMVPGYMGHFISDKGKVHLGIPLKAARGLTARWISPSEEFLLARGHHWSNRTKEAFKEVLGYEVPHGTPMTLEEVNAGYRQGLFKLPDEVLEAEFGLKRGKDGKFQVGKRVIRSLRDGRPLSPADLGVKIDFDVFPSNPIKSFHTRLMHGARLRSSAMFLQRMGKKFGRTAATIGDADSLARNGFRQVKLNNFTGLDNVFFPERMAAEIERLVPLFSERKEAGFFLNGLRSITSLWRHTTLFPVWRATAFSSRNWLSDVLLNWSAGMGAGRAVETGQAYLASFSMLTSMGINNVDSPLLRRLMGITSGKLSPTRLGIFDDIAEKVRDLESLKSFVDPLEAPEFLRRMHTERIIPGSEASAVGRTTVDEFLEQARIHGVLHQGFAGTAGALAQSLDALSKDAAEEIAGAGTKSFLGKLKAFADGTVGNILGTKKDAVGKRMASAMENHARLAHFYFEVFANKKSFQEAGEIVTSWHASKFVPSKADALLGDLFPFYSWMRFNIPTVFRLFAERPAKFAAMARAADYAMRGAEIDEHKFPDWVVERGGFPTHRFTDPETGQEYFGFQWVGNTIPFADIMNFDSTGRSWQWMIDNFNEPVKSAFEAVANFDLSLRRPLREGSVVLPGGEHVFGEVLGIPANKIDHVLKSWSVYQFANSYFGYQTPEQERRSTRTREGRLVAGIFPFTPSRRPVEEGNISRALTKKLMIDEIRAQMRSDARRYAGNENAMTKVLAKGKERIADILSQEVVHRSILP